MQTHFLLSENIILNLKNGIRATIFNEMNADEHKLAHTDHTSANEKQGYFVSTNDDVASQITNDCRTDTFLIIPMTIFIRYSTKLQIIAVRYIVRLPSHTSTVDPGLIGLSRTHHID